MNLAPATERRDCMIPSKANIPTGIARSHTRLCGSPLSPADRESLRVLGEAIPVWLRVAYESLPLSHSRLSLPAKPGYIGFGDYAVVLSPSELRSETEESSAFRAMLDAGWCPFAFGEYVKGQHRVRIPDPICVSRSRSDRRVVSLPCTLDESEVEADMLEVFADFDQLEAS